MIVKKVIVDMSNIKVGGGVQVALSFLNYLTLSQNDKVDFYYIISTPVYNQCNGFNFDKNNLFIVDTNYKTIFPFSKSRYKIRSLIKKISPDIIFTLFGPSFWGKARGYIHIVGFANAWIVSPETVAYNEFPFLYKYKFKFKNYVLGRLLYSKERRYITETEDIKAKFISMFGANDKMVTVIPNSLPYMYSKKNLVLKCPDVYQKFPNAFKLITIAENYPHKNIKIIECVGKELRSKGFYFVFFVTMSQLEYQKMSQDFRTVTCNLGKLQVEDCPAHYYHADIMFLPTLLECFSVSYLESMYCGTVIATSNMSFATEICGEAAVYFDPKSVDDIVFKLSQLMSNPSLLKQYSLKSKSHLNHHITNTQRSQLYINEILR